MFIVYTCVYINALKSTFDLVIKIKNKKRRKEEREREREEEWNQGNLKVGTWKGVWKAFEHPLFNE